MRTISSICLTSIYWAPTLCWLGREAANSEYIRFLGWMAETKEDGRSRQLGVWCMANSFTDPGNKGSRGPAASSGNRAGPRALSTCLHYLGGWANPWEFLNLRSHIHTMEGTIPLSGGGWLWLKRHSINISSLPLKLAEERGWRTSGLWNQISVPVLELICCGRLGK